MTKKIKNIYIKDNMNGYVHVERLTMAYKTG